MRRSLVYFIVGFLVAVSTINFSHRYHVGRRDAVPRIDVVQWSQSIADEQVAQWRIEVARKYPDAVIIVCHGDDEDGHWVFCPDEAVMVGPIGIVTPLPRFSVEEGIKSVQKQFPGRTIVLITCNPGHYHLTVPGVVYALDNVWLEPDRFLMDRSEKKPNNVGNIFEFQTN